MSNPDFEQSRQDRGDPNLNPSTSEERKIGTNQSEQVYFNFDNREACESEEETEEANENYFDLKQYGKKRSLSNGDSFAPKD